MAELATAWRADQLVPGDPDDVELLAARFGTCATGASDAAHRLRRLGHEGWQGAAAEAFADQVGKVPRTLDRGVASFRSASDALKVHARVLRAAQLSAGSALRRWEQAEAHTRAWLQEDPQTRAVDDPGAPGRRRWPGSPTSASTPPDRPARRRPGRRDRRTAVSTRGRTRSCTTATSWGSATPA